MTAIGNRVVNAADLAPALQDAIPAATIAAVDDADGSATVTVQAKDAGGNNLSARVLMRIWTSGRGGADLGAPAAIATDFSSTTGTDIEEVTADADYIVLSDASGVVVMSANDAADGELWFMVSIGGFTYSDSATITQTP